MEPKSNKTTTKATSKKEEAPKPKEEKQPENETTVEVTLAGKTKSVKFTIIDN